MSTFTGTEAQRKILIEAAIIRLKMVASCLNDPTEIDFASKQLWIAIGDLQSLTGDTQ
jgi:hypothetical protein